MTKYLYDLFLTKQKNNCTDYAVDAKAMLLHDARYGERKYTDEQTDIVSLHADAAELDAQMDVLLDFITKHSGELSAALDLESREAFDKVVAQCIAADQKRDEEQNAE